MGQLQIEVCSGWRIVSGEGILNLFFILSLFAQKGSNLLLPILMTMMMMMMSGQGEDELFRVGGI